MCLFLSLGKQILCERLGEGPEGRKVGQGLVSLPEIVLTGRGVGTAELGAQHFLPEGRVV